VFRSRAPTNAATRIDRVRRSRPFRSARGTDEWSAPANGNVWFAGEAERPALGSQPVDADPVARAAVIAALGHRRSLTADEVAIARAATADASAAVRAAAVAALVRAAPVRAANSAWQRATRDTEARVRRRAADLAPALAARRRRPDPAIADHLVAQLADPEVTVVEAAAWALGEIPRLDDGPIVAALAEVVTGHRDALAREAAVASLGAIGDPRGLAAVLTATNDKPPVRRRAVLALAPFEGAAVDAALARALEDRDWQVRQAAEDLGASP
jgi:HEAT repeat protein